VRPPGCRERGVVSLLSFRSGLADRLSVLLLAGLCVLVLVVFRDYGISNDEDVQHRYGEMIVRYYASGLHDTALFNYKNLYLYGGLFDIVAVLLAKLLPFDLYLIRHLLSALVGIGGIAATWATARLIGGARAGLIAAGALAICGPYFGGMFNHTKDVPFAAAMIGAVYFLLRAARDLPKPAWRHLFGFGAMLGAAAGLRAMGLLLVGYCLLLAAALSVNEGADAGDVAGAARRFARAVLYFLPALLVGYLIMLAAWPWAALAPLNPLRAIFSFAHFHYEIRTIVAGEIYTMAEVPRWYVPFYLLIKTPLVVFAGALLALASLARGVVTGGVARICRRDLETGFIVFIALFPVVCEVIAEGPAFTGMRHFMFVLPPLAVLAGLGFDRLFCALSGRRRLMAAAAAALALVMGWNASVLVRLHPYEYMFYNPLVGGLQGAARRYEMDYWVNIMPAAVAALQNYLGLPADPSQKKYTVGVCGETFSFDNYADRRLSASAGWLESDFYIAPTHMNCDRVVDGRIVASIERMGVVIGVVKDRRGVVQKTIGKAF
jgi:hypothetical protein